MDHYPEVNVSQRECASRTESNASSIHKIQHYDTKNMHSPPQYIPDAAPRDRNDSVASDKLVAEYAQYTDAPPPYSEQQYKGKSEEQQNKMRMADYAKEIKRMMGKQLVRGLKTGETKTDS